MTEETKKPVKIERIYADYEDKFVKAIMLYSSNDAYLFYDEDFTEPVIADDLERLFLNGVVIKTNGVLIKPTMFEYNSNVVRTEGSPYFCEGSIAEEDE